MKTSKPRKKSTCKIARKSPRSSTRVNNVRSPKQSNRGEAQLIVGIDPANATSGLCVLNEEGNLIWCGTLSVWEPLPNYLTSALGVYAGQTTLSAKIWYERSPVRGKPANDAISRAAGMLIQNLRDTFFKTLKRADVHAVEPATWRKAVYGNGRPQDPKTTAIHYYIAATGVVPETHDEAEAYCIARYGLAMEKKGGRK